MKTMTVRQKARQLALTLIGEDQNPEPLIELLIDMAAWQRLEIIKELNRGSRIYARGN